MSERQMIDTNVLIRYITKDVAKLYEKAHRLLARMDVEYVVDVAVVAEVVHVLENEPYVYSRGQIERAVMAIAALSNVDILEKDIVEGVLRQYAEHPKLSYIDCYLAVKARRTRNIPLWTFDKKLVSQAAVAEMVR